MRLHERGIEFYFRLVSSGESLRGSAFTHPKWCKLCKRWRYAQPRDRVLPCASRVAFRALRGSVPSPVRYAQ